MASKVTDYFAAQTAEELVSHIETKVNEDIGFRARAGLQRRWIKSYRFYYGNQFKVQNLTMEPSILRLGEQGELTGVTVNHFRNFIKHLLSMTVNQKVSFDVRAINTDTDSIQQARLGGNILDAYLHGKRLNRYNKLAAEIAQVMSKGFVYVYWDKEAGRPYGAEYAKTKEGEIYLDDNGQPVERIVYEGDLDIKCLTPFDVFTDQSSDDFGKLNWVTIRTYKNKFDLAARHPDIEDQILSLPTRGERDRLKFLTVQQVEDSTDVPVYEFYHKRTPSMPNGRYVIACSSDVVLYDGPIPYDRLPIFRIVPGEIFGTTEGYTDAFDLINLQEALNLLASTILSNQNAHGVQNVLIPDGANLTVQQLGKALKGLKYNPQAGKPEALQLTATPAEVFKMTELLERWMETLSGVNSVARGNPDSSLKSGVALGLVQSMAIQYASSFQQSWAELNEDVGSFILWLIKNFAKTERMIAMAGKNNRGHMLRFKGSDLEKVERVVVDLGNPLIRTTAGRLQLADTLLEKGLIKTPQEYLTVLSTGQLDAMTEGVESQLSLIRMENEALLEGKPVQAVVGDSHLLHCQEHLTILSNPDIRMKAAQGDPQAVAVVQAVTSHIMQHKELGQTQDPFFSAISGEPPIQPPAPQGPPAPGPEGAPMPGPEGQPAPQAGPPAELPPPPDVMPPPQPPMPKTAAQPAPLGGM